MPYDLNFLSGRTLLLLDNLSKPAVQFPPISSVMSLPMTVRAKGRNPVRVIGASIRKAANVMWFQVRSSLAGPEGRLSFASFTLSISSFENVNPDSTATV